VFTARYGLAVSVSFVSILHVRREAANSPSVHCRASDSALLHGPFTYLSFCSAGLPTVYSSLSPTVLASVSCSVTNPAQQPFSQAQSLGAQALPTVCTNQAQSLGAQALPTVCTNQAQSLGAQALPTVCTNQAQSLGAQALPTVCTHKILTAVFTEPMTNVACSGCEWNRWFLG
jgi:hypothetical protein